MTDFIEFKSVSYRNKPVPDHIFHGSFAIEAIKVRNIAPPNISDRELGLTIYAKHSDRINLSLLSERVFVALTDVNRDSWDK